jgi:hypothetical protein
MAQKQAQPPLADARRPGLTSPAPWMLCATCDIPKAQHELPHCHSQAIVAGVLYQCARRHPHDGQPHQQDDATWGMHA